MQKPVKKTYLLDTPLLRSRLKLKALQSEGLLRSHHPQAVGLLEASGVRPDSLRAHAAKLLTAGAATGALVFSAPAVLPLAVSLPSSAHNLTVSPTDQRIAARKLLSEILPTQIRPLTETEGNQVSQILHQLFGIHAVATLEGNSLNTDYGLIGAEQHLPRYPGDTVSQHDSLRQAGITPGRGAWGYFANLKKDLTPDLILKEKYYVAVQTLYLPDWSTRLAYLRDWYKHRKMVVLNPRNGHAVVAVVADSGPAAWTGKQFGGSPEVMDYLRSKDGRQRGPVVMFFVDDPDNRVPLGPLEYNLEAQPPLLTAH